MTEAEYKAEWQLGFHQTDYNNCRFADDKIKYCEDWLSKNVESYQKGYKEYLVTDVCNQKLRIAKDKEYCQLCSEWSDKLAVNDKLTELGLSDLIIPNYAELNHIETLDHILTPKITTDIIIKCNHGSGWNKIIRENTTIETVRRSVDELKEWLTLNYAYIAGYEAQYENIKPNIIVQKLLVDTPMDYGFWCVNGEIKAISFTKKLGKNLERYLAFVNPDGTAADKCIGMKPEMGNLPNKFVKIIDSMKEAVETIAKPFDFVRVDMYHIDGKNYFGETTFTPCGGRLAITTR